MQSDPSKNGRKRKDCIRLLKLFLKISFYLLMNFECVHAWYVYKYGYPWRPGLLHSFSAGVVGGSEPPSVGAGDTTRVHCDSAELPLSPRVIDS